MTSDEEIEMARLRRENDDLKLQVKIGVIDAAFAKQLSASMTHNARLITALRAAKAHLERNRCGDDVLKQVTDAIEGASE